MNFPKLRDDVLEPLLPVSFADLPMADLVDLFAEAACRFDPELHTGPDDSEVPEPLTDRAARIDVAKAVCADCPFAAPCLEYALRIRPQHGIYAGYTPAELATTVRAEQNAEAA